eukprot:GHVU01061704.1.p1 GENE.GHVU01061704.1~~GHVU01061704.1.p1  ORF type:complete len:342 (+),score=15.83 GHVU01061704.1:209-1234(+)
MIASVLGAELRHGGNPARHHALARDVGWVPKRLRGAAAVFTPAPVGASLQMVAPTDLARMRRMAQLFRPQKWYHIDAVKWERGHHEGGTSYAGDSAALAAGAVIVGAGSMAGGDDVGEPKKHRAQSMADGFENCHGVARSVVSLPDCVETYETTHPDSVGVQQFPANSPIEDRGGVANLVTATGEKLVLAYVIDGHGGHSVADFAYRKLGPVVQQFLLQGVPIEEALPKAIQRIDDALMGLMWGLLPLRMARTAKASLWTTNANAHLVISALSPLHTPLLHRRPAPPPPHLQTPRCHSVRSAALVHAWDMWALMRVLSWAWRYVGGCGLGRRLECLPVGLY